MQKMVKSNYIIKKIKIKKSKHIISGSDEKVQEVKSLLTIKFI